MDEKPDAPKPAKGRLPKITGKTEAQVERLLARSQAMSEARDEALQTPVEVRRAFLPKRRGIGRLRFQPLCLGIIWIFEELKHPFNKKKGTGRPLSVADTARAIFAFVAPEDAGEALGEGLEAYDAGAAEVVAQIHPRDLAEISAEIGKIYADGMGSIPGADDAAAPETPREKKGGDAKDSEKERFAMPPKTSGIGWTLTLLDMMLHEYPWPSYTFRGEVRTAMHWVIWRLPLAQAMALYAAIGPRYGKEPDGQTYQTKAMIRASQEERKKQGDLSAGKK